MTFLKNMKEIPSYMFSSNYIKEGSQTIRADHVSLWTYFRELICAAYSFISLFLVKRHQLLKWFEKKKQKIKVQLTWNT